MRCWPAHQLLPFTAIILCSGAGQCPSWEAELAGGWPGLMRQGPLFVLAVLLLVGAGCAAEDVKRAPARRRSAAAEHVIPASSVPHPQSKAFSFDRLLVDPPPPPPPRHPPPPPAPSKHAMPPPPPLQRAPVQSPRSPPPGLLRHPPPRRPPPPLVKAGAHAAPPPPVRSLPRTVSAPRSPAPEPHASAAAKTRVPGALATSSLADQPAEFKVTPAQPTLAAKSAATTPASAGVSLVQRTSSAVPKPHSKPHARPHP